MWSRTKGVKVLKRALRRDLTIVLCAALPVFLVTALALFLAYAGGPDPMSSECEIACAEQVDRSSDAVAFNGCVQECTRTSPPYER